MGIIERVSIGFFDGRDDFLNVTLRRGSDKLITEYVLWQKWDGHVRSASVKNIAKMSYSGRKLRAQKGTGMPPIGFRAAPMLRGGAAIHAPLPRIIHRKMNRKAKKIAISTLLFRLWEKDLIRIIPQDMISSAAKTSDYVDDLGKIGYSVQGRLLYILPIKIAILGMRNVPGHDVLPISGLNCISLLSHDRILISQDVFSKLENEGTWTLGNL